MRPIRDIENLSDLEKKQMKAIDELQDRIKLFEFDRTKDRQQIRDLKLTILRKNETIHGIIKELEIMHKEKNYKNLRYITNALRTTSREEEKYE